VVLKALWGDAVSNPRNPRWPASGPFDLSKQMNVQFGSDEHEAAIQKTLKAAKSAGKTAAIFCECHTDFGLCACGCVWLWLCTGSNGAQAKERLAQGFDMVSITTDVGSVAAEFDRQLAATLGVEVGQARSAY
jgi:4-hydroxy-2-oxoheptanedioate aldolase